MSYPKFSGSARANVSAQPFENYLKQIHNAFPNVPKLYDEYMQKVHEFGNSELVRSIEELQFQVTNTFTDDFYLKLDQLKRDKPDHFELFLYLSLLKYKMIDLLDIQTVLNATVLFDIEMSTSIHNQFITFNFMQPREQIYFVTFSLPFVQWQFVRDSNNLITGVQVEMNMDFIGDVTMITIVGGGY